MQTNKGEKKFESGDGHEIRILGAACAKYRGYVIYI
jgi:hypothetical protein